MSALTVVKTSVMCLFEEAYRNNFCTCIICIVVILKLAILSVLIRVYLAEGSLKNLNCIITFSDQANACVSPKLKSRLMNIQHITIVVYISIKFGYEI